MELVTSKDDIGAISLEEAKLHFTESEMRKIVYKIIRQFEKRPDFVSVCIPVFIPLTPTVKAIVITRDEFIAKLDN